MAHFLQRLIAAACLACATAAAQTFPSKPVRLIVPGAAGSILDVASRQLADKLIPTLGQPVLVDNKVGAGGQIGMEATARSAPDGHTIAITNFTMMGVNPHMFDRMPYDSVRDFAPVMLLYRAPLVLAARAEFPANSVNDLVRLAKVGPGKLMYGSSGNGQPPHVLTELFKFKAGIDLNHVPYRGAAASVMALLAGEVSVIIESASAVIPHVKAGRLKALAVTGERRIDALPEAPTFAQAGIPGIDDSWVGIVAPAATPRDIVGRLNRELGRALESADIKAYYESAGRRIVASSPEEFAAVIKSELAKWRDVVKTAGIKPG